MLASTFPALLQAEYVRLGDQAVTEFKDVLSIDPNNLSAIDGIGSLLFQMAGTPYDPKKLRGIQDLPPEAHSD